MLESLTTPLLLVLGILMTTLGIAGMFQEIEDRAAAQSRCPDCRRELEGRPAFCPDCGARSRY